MDREKFDALARLLGAEGTRRSALGALVGAALLGTGIDAEAGKRRRRKKNRKRNRKQARRQEQQQIREALQAPCFGNKGCVFPDPGKRFTNCLFPGINIDGCSGCDFDSADLGSADMDFANFQGSSFQRTNLRAAELAFSDVSGADFTGACLASADFFGANVDGAKFKDAIFCNTIWVDGQVNNTGCSETNRCCQPCRTAGQSCSADPSLSCCGGQCIGGICQVECVKDTDCNSDGDEQFCCDGICQQWCCDDGQCGGGVCIDGRCEDLECFKDVDCDDEGINDTCCFPLCVDIANDPNNCGECGRQCAPDEVCALGDCFPS
jgi:hypothetical protein